MIKIWTFMEVKMAITHFVTQYTHVSIHFGVYCRKQKQMFRENCFENVISDFKKKWPMCQKKTMF